MGTVASTTLLEGQEIALDVQRFFVELDRTGSRLDPERRERVRGRLAELRLRLERWAAGVETETFQTRAVDLAEALTLDVDARTESASRDRHDEAAPTLDVQAPLASLRKEAQPRYELLAEALRERNLAVPSIRPKNYARNALHVASSLAGLATVELTPSFEYPIAIAFTIAALGWSLEFGRRRSAAINAFCMKLFGATAHPHEARRVNSATWFISALSLLSLTHSHVACAIALLVLGFGDPAAAIIGRRFGRISVGNGRTLEGTSAFVVVGGGVALGYLALTSALPFSTLAITALVGATCGAIAEAVSRNVDDNFSIPMTAGFSSLAALLLLGS